MKGLKLKLQMKVGKVMKKAIKHKEKYAHKREMVRNSPNQKNTGK
jgi:hypothetical protein